MKTKQTKQRMSKEMVDELMPFTGPMFARDREVEQHRRQEEKYLRREVLPAVLAWLSNTDQWVMSDFKRWAEKQGYKVVLDINRKGRTLLTGNYATVRVPGLIMEKSKPKQPQKKSAAADH